MDKFIFHFFDRGMASNANGVAERADQPLPQRTVCDCIHARLSCPADSERTAVRYPLGGCQSAPEELV